MTETATLTNINSTIDHTIEQLAFLAVDAADDRKAEDQRLINISAVSTLADYLLIVTGFSKVQLRAISGSVIDKIEADLQRLPLRTEGQDRGGWILIDYGDLIVHIMMPEQREFYDLESFWGHGETVALTLAAAESHSSTQNTYDPDPDQI
jgi:ribosome-associated protein